MLSFIGPVVTALNREGKAMPFRLSRQHNLSGNLSLELTAEDIVIFLNTYKSGYLSFY